MATAHNIENRQAPTADIFASQRAIAALFAPEQIIELRCIKKGDDQNEIYSGYFDRDHISDLTAEAEKLNADGAQCYVTVNAINEALHERAPNTIRSGGASTTDRDVTRRHYFLIDIDPKRPAGVSASDAEKAAALVVSRSIFNYLTTELGWPAPITADSGNGYHLMYRVNEPNDDATRDVFKAALAALAHRFDTEAAAVDRGVFNASRIWKLYGTVAAKGEHAPDRPHRLASLISIPDAATLVTREQIAALAGTAPKKDQPTAPAASPAAAADTPSRQPSGGQQDIKPRTGDRFRAVNDMALLNLSSWVPELFPNAREYNGGYRVTSRNLNRDLEEDLGLMPQGIQDFGTERTMTAIDIVLDFAGIADATQAAQWLAERIGFEWPAIGQRQGSVIEDDDLSEIAIANTLVSEMNMNLAYVATWNKWFFYDGGTWCEDVKMSIYSAAKRVVSAYATAAPEKMTRALKNSKTVNGVVSIARYDQRVAASSDDFDKNPLLLNTPAGTVDLTTGIMREHVRDEMHSMCTAVAPDFNASSPVWDRFMLEIFCKDDELIEYVKSYIGYCMSGMTDIHELHFWYGEGRNGKSTLIELVEWLLKGYAAKATEDVLVARPNGHGHLSQLAVLRGKRLAFASEIAEGARWDEARIKTLTGDGTITANYMRQNPFTFKREVKFFAIANSRPSFSHVDVALRARLKLIPFLESFRGREDTELPQKLRAEGPAILASLIRAAVPVFNGKRPKCARVDLASAGYLNAMDDLELFAAECLDPYPAHAVASKAVDLLAAFNEWKRERGESSLSMRRFGERMRSRYGEPVRSDGFRYTGVRLNHAWEARSLDASAAARERSTPQSKRDMQRRQDERDRLAIRSGIDLDEHKKMHGDD